MPRSVPQGHLAVGAPQRPAGAAGRDDDPATPLRAGLAAAVVELERTAADAAALQIALSPLLLRGGGDVQACQALDALTQHLQGLADFLSQVARACPMDWRFNAERAGGPLRLHAQKLRLVYGPAAETPAPRDGDVELW